MSLFLKQVSRGIFAGLIAAGLAGCLAGGLFTSHHAPPCFQKDSPVHITFRVAANAGNLRGNDRAIVQVQRVKGKLQSLEMALEKSSKREMIWGVDVMPEHDASSLEFFFKFRVDGKWYEHGTTGQMKTIPVCDS